MTDHQFSRLEPLEASADVNADRWRHEIHSRVAKYKSRRGRRIEGAFSMRFPFPPTEAEGVAVAAAPGPLIGEDASVGVDENSHFEVASAIDVAPAEAKSLPALPAHTALALTQLTRDASAPFAELPEFPNVSGSQLEEEPRLPVAPRPRARRKVIAFPRQQSVTYVSEGLADPVYTEQPRILDVPEELASVPTTPYLDGLQFEVSRNPQPSSGEEHTELPCRVISVAQRLQAAAVDAGIVAAGFAVFAGVAYKLMPPLVMTKSLLAGAAAVPVLLWMVYQYLFLVYGAKTVGMQATGIRLCTFAGAVPALSVRRARAVGLLLSTSSLGMGLLWVFVDVDALCWHDRISQTFPAPSS